jgi:hypothetical protein
MPDALEELGTIGCPAIRVMRLVVHLEMPAPAFLHRHGAMQSVPMVWDTCWQ